MTTTRLLPGAVGVVATLVGVYVAGVTSVALALQDGGVANWWPAAGLAVGLVAVVPRPLLGWSVAGVLVVAAAANWSGDRPWDLSLALGVVNAVEAWLAGLVLRRAAHGRPALATLDDFFRLVGACLVATLIGATGAALAVVTFIDGDFLATWRTVGPSHLAATLVLVPVALAWRSTGPPPERVGELLVQVSGLVAATAIVFGPDQHLALTYVPLPFLVWAGLRFGVRTTSLQVAALAVAVTWLSAVGGGPFADHAGHDDLSTTLRGFMVQGFLLSLVVMTLPLAATVAQRSRLLTRVVASEQLFRRNFTGSVVGQVLLRRREGHLVLQEANDAAARILGVEAPAEIAGRRLADFLADGAVLEQAARELAEGRVDTWSAEAELAPPCDHRARLHLALILHDEEGALFGAQLRDVTEEHRSRESLRAERELLRATLDSTGALILVTDTAGTVVRVNPATTSVTGYSRTALVGAPLWRHLTDEAARDWLQELVTAPRDDTGSASGVWPARQQESEVVAADGRRLRIVWAFDVVRDAAGAATHVVLTGTDVTAERAAAGLMSRVMQSDLGTALVGVDRHGLVTEVNGTAARLLGQEAACLVGTPFADLFDPDELSAWARARGCEPTFASLAAWAASDGVDATREWTWQGAPGTSTLVSMTLSVVRDVSSAEVGYFCVARDVTAQRRSHELLVAALEKERHASDRLRHLDEAKNEFVSTVSHELRTPVTSIVGYAEMLSDGAAGELDARQASMLAAIERNGRRLISLADDLLTLARLESHAQPPDLVRLDLRDLVHGARDALGPLLATRWLDVEFAVPDHPVPVHGDPGQLDRALLNLLSNAVKFTEDGGAISCRLEAGEAEARLVVADTGIGIPRAEQPALFSKFYRSTAAQERAIQGTGLGLSIVASIVDSHGGRVEVTSEPGEGSCFTVSLPLAERAERLGQEATVMRG